MLCVCWVVCWVAGLGVGWRVGSVVGCRVVSFSNGLKVMKVRFFDILVSFFNGFIIWGF